MRFRALLVGLFFVLPLTTALHAEELSIVEYNAPSGFREEFSRILGAYTNTQLSDEWVDPPEADIWVAFIESPQDNLTLPVVAERVLQETRRQNPGPFPEPFFTFKGNINDRQITIMYFFTDDLASEGKSLNCASAILLALDQEYITSEQAIQETETCAQNI